MVGKNKIYTSGGRVMKNQITLYGNSNSFCGNKISDYGIQYGYIDYATLAKAFDAVLNNDIISKTSENNIGYWEIVNGCDYDEESDSYCEVYQYYIISESGYQILERYTDEIVWYNEELDMYVWGVTHFGTSWDYVLTDIKIKRNK